MAFYGNRLQIYGFNILLRLIAYKFSQHDIFYRITR